MRIGTVVLHSCIRAHKQAWEMQRRGHKNILLSEALNALHGWWRYEAGVQLFVDPDNPLDYPFWHFKRTVETIDPLVDVWHCHNEPDWTVSVIRSLSRKPIVWDIHDMKSKREGKVEPEEADALRDCSAVVTPSRKYVRDVESRTDKPVIEVLSCVPSDIYPKKRCRVLHRGLVYEGGLGTSTPGALYQEFPCRNWADVFAKCMDMGIPTWAYRANSAVDLTPYTRTGVMVLGPFRYDAMIQNLTAHEFGLCGSPFPDLMFDGALPNKLFEYIAAGLPVINMNAPDVEEFLLATGLGITVSSVEEIPDAMEIMRKENYRDRVWEMRHHWSMESQGDKLEELYRSLTRPPSHNLHSLGEG